MINVIRYVVHHMSHECLPAIILTDIVICENENSDDEQANWKE